MFLDSLFEVPDPCSLCLLLFLAAKMSEKQPNREVQVENLERVAL